MSDEQFETPCGVPDLLYDAHLHILPVINKLKNMFVTKKGNELVKCKIRFGRLENSTLNAEVSRMFFMQTLVMLQRFQEWKDVKNSYDTHDYYYNLNVPSQKAKKQKTAVQGDGSTNKIIRSRTHFLKKTEGYQMHVEHTYCHDKNKALLHVNNRSNLDVEIEVQQVSPIMLHVIPTVVVPFHVCLRTQTMFSLENWNFIFTREWAGPTRIDAETKQFRDKDKDSCVHKIHIEFIGTTDYINNLTADYFSVSLLLKICSLLGGNVIHLNPIRDISPQ